MTYTVAIFTILAVLGGVALVLGVIIGDLNADEANLARIKENEEQCELYRRLAYAWYKVATDGFWLCMISILGVTAFG